MFCEPPQPKRKVYNRESKLKGKVFINVVTGKNKNGKKGKKCDLETGFNDIDILLEKMGKAEMSVDRDSNMEKCNLQVASIHQIEEGKRKKSYVNVIWNKLKKNLQMTVAQRWVKRINGIEVVNKANPKRRNVHITIAQNQVKRKLRQKLQKGLWQKLQKGLWQKLKR